MTILSFGTLLAGFPLPKSKILAKEPEFPKLTTEKVLTPELNEMEAGKEGAAKYCELEALKAMAPCELGPDVEL